MIKLTNFNLPQNNSIKVFDKIIWYSILVFSGSLIFSIAIGQTLAIILMLLFITKKIVYGDYSFVKNPVNIPFLCFVTGRLLSVFLSTNFQSSYPSLYKEIVIYFLFFVLVNEIDIKNKSKAALLLQVIILSALVAAIRGIIIYIFIDKARITSTTSGYYTLGMFLTAVFSLSLMIGNHKEIFLKRFIWWIVNFILVAAILLTFDRMHWIAMTVSVIIAGIVKERKFLIVYFVLAGGAVLLYPQLLERIMMVINDMNISERQIIWKGAGMLFWNHPVFGFGTRTFNEIFPLYNQMVDKGTSSWHNDILQVYMESGILGLIALIYFIYSLLRNGIKAIKNFKNNGDLFYKDITSGLLLAFIAFLVGGFLLDPILAMLFLIVVSLIALLIVRSKNEIL